MRGRLLKISLIAPALAFVFILLVSLSGLLLAIRPGSWLLWFVEIELRGSIRTAFHLLDHLGFSDPLRCAVLAATLLLACLIAARAHGVRLAFLLNHAVLILLGVSFSSEVSVTAALLTQDVPIAAIVLERVLADVSVLKVAVFALSLVSCAVTHALILAGLGQGFAAASRQAFFRRQSGFAAPCPGGDGLHLHSKHDRS
jgi:hypothetical protein